MPDAAAPRKPSPNRGVCAITGREMSKAELVSLENVRPSLLDMIRADHPEVAADATVCRSALATYRMRYVESLLRDEQDGISELDRQVAESLANHDTVAENIDDEFEEHRTLGERWADNLAAFGGSWAFIITFLGVMAVWMGINLLLATTAFDPYPFILLNLVLSCLAALQAPVIMMSQKRQEAKDRLRSRNDYLVNMKAELEIRHLHEKLDHLISRQWQRLAEIQQVQLEILNERSRRR